MADPKASAAYLALGHFAAPDLSEVYHLDQTPEEDNERTHSPTPDTVDSADILHQANEIDACRKPSPWRRAFTFAVIAILLVLFSLIVFFGLVQSVWWY